MEKVKRFGFAALLFTAGALTAGAQDEVEATASADFVSTYVWRGQKCGDFSIQPTLGLAYKGLSLTAWGSTELMKSESAHELDFTLAYTTGGFNIGVTDYWFDNTADSRYFYYNAHTTAHVFEGNVGYDFGPVAVQWYTNFAGNDFKYKDSGARKHAYSSYIEVSAPFKLGGMDWTATLGAVPYESPAYGVEDFAVTNVSVKAQKDIQITPSFSVPLFASINTNPAAQKAYLVVGFTLHP